MKKGDKIKIYQKPLTFEGFEGEATLVAECRPDEGDGLSMWEVEFDDEIGRTWWRTIYTPAKELKK